MVRINQLTNYDVAHLFIACCAGYGLHSLSFVVNTLQSTQTAEQLHRSAILNHVVVVPFGILLHRANDMNTRKLLTNGFFF